MPGRAKRVVYAEPLTSEQRGWFDQFLRDFGYERGDDPILVAMHSPVLCGLRRACEESRMPAADISQSGMMGVVKAARKFNPRHVTRKGKRPASFKTYALWWIRSEVGHELARHRGEPIRRQVLPNVRLNDIDAANLADERHAIPDEAAERSEAAGVVDEFLRMLPPREERVIRGRFGIGRPESGLKEMGDELGVVKERVRQLEEVALRRMRVAAERAAERQPVLV